MKATARAITCSIRAAASPVGRLMAHGYGLPTGVMAKAEATDETGVRAYLRVEPEEPKQLVWLVPQYGIDYHVIASKSTKWNIV